MPVLSIIVPVYNVATYLREGLDSILRQEVQDIEVICVDDCSSDSSPDILKEYQAKDNRIQFIRQSENKGPSATRNIGIKYAKGKYIAFFDPDDKVENNLYAELIHAIEDKKTDLALCGLTQEFKDGNCIDYIPQQSLNFELGCNHTNYFVMLNEQNLLYGPIVKLYKNNIIQHHQILFDPQVSYGEDLLFNYQYLEYAHTIACINESHYHYRILGSGTLSSKFRPKQFDTDYQQWKILQSFYQRHHLWSSTAQTYLYKRLWGILYDGIFLYPRLQNKKISYLRTILAIPEIKKLKDFTQCFSCSNWIKQSILYRLYPIFYIYFSIIAKR
jgi:glycosyltransferase involved in cell wall biosynthesis